MRLAAGDRLGPYEIVGTLGTGGMGEVYRARDSRLCRDVAVKVLPADRMADEGRRRRFVQEARAASALSHPNIVTIHEIESADSVDFIVMEHVPGQSLDGLIPKRGMTVAEALRLAIPLADALATAHAAGIVHRDLKPANVVVSREGVVKLLDFGVAKLLADDRPGAAGASTASGSEGLAGPGAITGTAAYMSPEQATGGDVDARSDIFSFGALLYEMVTGRRAFGGKTTSETLTAVIRAEPMPPRELVPGIPDALERLILLCLRKEPQRRFQHVADVKVALEDIRERDSAAELPSGSAGRRRRVLLSAGAVLLLVVMGGAQLYRPAWLKTSPDPYVVPLTFNPGYEVGPALSPDGNQIAFAWDGEKREKFDLYVKIIGSSDVHRLTTDPAANTSPSWSPDGSRIAFVRQPSGPMTGRIHVISPLGEGDRKLSDVPVSAAPLSWSRDGKWLATGAPYEAAETWTEPRGIRLVDTSSGEARPLTSAAPSTYHFAPSFSPDGRYLSYFSCLRRHTCQVAVVELGPDAKPLSPARLITRSPIWPRGGLAWTRDSKAVVYSNALGFRLWRVGIAGNAPPERIEVAGYYAFLPTIAVSRDRLAFSRITPPPQNYRCELGGQPSVVAASSFGEYEPRFSPDGRRLVWDSQRNGEVTEVWVGDADGRNSVQLAHGPGLWQGSPRWSPDGRRIAFDSYGEDGQWDIWTIDADGGPPLRLTSNPADDNLPSWSRDGRFVYFSSNRTGTEAIWRVPSTGGSEEQVTRDGGGQSQESTDGTTLFYQRSFGASSLMAAPLAGGPVRTLLNCVPRNGWDVGAAGLYHETCDGSPDRKLYLLDRATGRDRLVGALSRPYSGITVSPDGKTIIYNSLLAAGADLMLIENFR